MIISQVRSLIFISEFYAVAKYPAHARVKKRNFFESIGVAAVRKTSVERFGINVQADGAVVKFGKV